METISRTVGALEPGLRQAMEAIVGHALESSQELVIQVLEPKSSSAPDTPSAKLPPWCGVLADLTAEEDAALTSSIRARTESRALPGQSG